MEMVSVGFWNLSRQAEYDVEVFTLNLNLVLVLLHMGVQLWGSACTSPKSDLKVKMRGRRLRFRGEPACRDGRFLIRFLCCQQCNKRLQR